MPHLGAILHSALVGPGEPNILTGSNPNPISNIGPIPDFISSGQSTNQLINISNFLQSPSPTDPQILGGFADASKAINDLFDGLRQQTQVNEQQRAINNTFSKELTNQLGFNPDKTGGPIDLGKAGSGNFTDSLKQGFAGLTSNPLILFGGIALIGIMLLKK